MRATLLLLEEGTFHLQEFLIVIVLESKSAKCSEIKLTLTFSTLLS